MAKVVRAAGGAVWRRVTSAGGEGAGGEGDAPEGGVDERDIEVMLVHRPRYDDWSFPKGKCEPRESDEAAALREVDEETGLRCRLGAELETVEYRDGQGRPKVVRYWAMTVESSTPRSPDDEVDTTRWLPLDEAQVLLSYERDRIVARSLLNVLRGV
jgi:8-oxo-dGTP diphosphatase